MQVRLGAGGNLYHVTTYDCAEVLRALYIARAGKTDDTAELELAIMKQSHESLSADDFLDLWFVIFSL
jgi:hypothetical protein